MATKKVSALSALTSPDGAEELLINDGGTSKKITITNVSKLNLKGGDLTSADPLVIDTDGNYFDVTGTTNFTAMTVAANRQFTLQFDGILTMTHHATNLDLPSEANITTAAGDVATFQSTGANTVQCINYTRAAGTAIVAGSTSTATSSATGVVKLEDDTEQTVAANTVSATAGKTYGIQLNSSDQAVVNVPWTDTDTVDMGSGFTVSATTDSNATTITEGDDLMFTAGTGITCETTADGTVTIASTVTDTNTMGSGFTVSATTDSNATTITQGDDLMFTAGTGITCETTADGTVTISNTVSDTNTMGSGFTVSATTDTNATTITQGDDLMFTAGSGITQETTADGTVTTTLNLATDQSWSGSQRGTPSTVTDGTLDLDTANNFKYTPSGADTLEFSNEEAGQSGFITVINASGHAISLGSEVKKGSSWDVSTAGTYIVTYYCDGTSVYVSASEALS